MGKAHWIACAFVACMGCAAGGGEGSTVTDPSPSTDDPATPGTSQEGGRPIDGGKKPEDGGKGPVEDGATGNTGASGGEGGPGPNTDAMMPPVVDVPNYGTFVVPQLTAVGVGASQAYRLSLRIGAPQPYGRGTGVSHRITLGTVVGR